MGVYTPAIMWDKDSIGGGYTANQSLILTIFLMASLAIFGFCIILECKGLKNWQV
jgi:hypothetical protein